MVSENGQDRHNGKLTQQFRWILAGAAAGTAVDLSLYPLDTIKVSWDRLDCNTIGELILIKS